MPIDSLAFGLTEYPVNLRASVNGKVCVSTQGPAGSAGIYEVDFRNRTQRKRWHAAPSHPGGVRTLAYSGDRGVLFTSVAGQAMFMRYNPIADTYSPAFPGVRWNGTLTLDQTGQRTAVGTTVYDAAGSPLGQVIAADSSGSGAAAFSVDGQSFFSTYYSYGLLRTRIGTPGLADRSPLPTSSVKTIPMADGVMIMAGYAGFVTQKSPIYFVDVR